MSASQIYDIEGILEAAAQAVLNALSLEAFTTRSDPEFQKVRPRVEIEATLGGGLGRFVPIKDGAVVTSPTADVTPSELFFLRRESAWQVRLQFNIITEADITIHAEYRAKVRAALAQLWVSINAPATLPRHVLQLTKDNGSSPIMVQPEQGMMKTEITFDGSVSVVNGAWADLT